MEMDLYVMLCADRNVRVHVDTLATLANQQWGGNAEFLSRFAQPRNSLALFLVHSYQPIYSQPNVLRNPILSPAVKNIEQDAVHDERQCVRYITCAPSFAVQA